MSSKKITLESFQLLSLIDEICRRNQYGFAPISELIKIVTAQRGVKSVAVRKMTWKLAKEGYIENPLRGCWRLTEKGRLLLKEVQTG